nr:unnamed protein product [Callosobruchus analis]
MEDAHMKTVEEVHNYFGTDPERGLSSDQVKRFQEKYGPNDQCFYSHINDFKYWLTSQKDIIPDYLILTNQQIYNIVSSNKQQIFQQKFYMNNI